MPPSLNLTSTLVGAAATTAAALIIFGRPKDPTIHVVSISLSSFNLSFPLLDLDLTLTVHVTNPNLVPILYFPAKITIFYHGSYLGTASLPAASQPAMSCQTIKIPARMKGIEMAKHVKDLIADLARREMKMDAEVDVSGVARVLWRWEKRFQAHIECHVVVDPVFLDVVDQDNFAETHLVA